MGKFDDYDDDDLVDYDDEDYDEEMNSEDEEELMAAINEVKSMIGARKIKEEDIKESIYHYDFDTSKAAKYLNDKYDRANKPKQAPPPPSKQPKSKLESNPNFTSQQPQGQQHHQHQHNQGKPMSKLAALAQARAQKKTNDSTSQASLSSLTNKSASTSATASTSSLKSVNLLNKLGSGSDSAAIKRNTPISSTGGGSALSKLAKAREQRKNGTIAPSNGSTTGVKHGPSPTSLSIAPNETKVSKAERPKPRVSAPIIDYNVQLEYPKHLRAEPSAFSRLFCEGIKSKLVTPVTNTVFLPTDVTKVKQAFEKPSPDDVVQAAQEEGGFLVKGVNKMKIDNDAAVKPPQPAKNVRKLNVEEERSKAADQRPSVNFVVIGHVDAGKSTLMGRLLYDCGVIDQKTINKYKRESEKEGKGSFHLAWVLDQTAEERKRGVTIDICMSQFETDGAKFTIVDAPGHRDFVPNMIAGSAQADFAVLVVDSATNAFESGFDLDGQTKEHAILVRSLGVDSIIVAVNKLDTNGWSQERFEEIRIQLSEFLIKVGFKKSQISFVPTSGLLGDNVTKKSNEKALTSWYQGKTLLQTLEQSKSNEKDHKSDLRMLINDVSTAGHTSDIKVSGRIDTGSIQTGEQVYISPNGATGQVKGMTVNNSEKDWAIAGDNVTVRMINIQEDELKVGSVVCNVEAPVASVSKFTTRIVIFDIKRPLLTGTKLILHRGRTNEACKLSKIVATIDKTDGHVLKSKPRHLLSGQTADVEVTLENALPMEVFKSSKDLGRVILRKDGATVAAGIVDSLL